MSGFSSPAAAKTSSTPSDGHGARDDLAHGEVKVFFRARLSLGAFGQRRAHRLEERHVVADARRLLVRDG